MKLHFTETIDKKIYFSSDLHLNHDKEFIWKSRGYINSKDHTDAVINCINSVIKPDDIFITLGDFCLNTTTPMFEELISRINCKTVYMLWGNHYNPQYNNIYKPIVKSLLGNNYTYNSEIYPVIYKNVIFIGNYAELIVNNQYIVISHFPLSVFDEMSSSSWCLCGHTHYKYNPTTSDSLFSKILDVGWDGHGKPWSFDELIDVMNKKQIPTGQILNNGNKLF